MTLLWDKFISVMSQILEEYQALLAISEEKQKKLVAADVDYLVNITKQEEIIVLKINKLEWRRKAAIKELAAAYELKGEPQGEDFAKTISGLKKLAGEKDAVRIEEVSGELMGCIEKLKGMNELNTKLIKQSLDFIEFNINILSAASCEQTYTANPKESSEQTKRRAILNAQV